MTQMQGSPRRPTEAYFRRYVEGAPTRTTKQMGHFKKPFPSRRAVTSHKGFHYDAGRHGIHPGLRNDKPLSDN